MTTSPTTPSPADTSDSLRLRLHTSQRSGAADGAWWPRSRDLQTEAADLVDHFPEDSGHISRLVFSRPDWDAGSDGRALRSIDARRGRVKVGSFPSDDTHLMILTLSTGSRLKLVVIPHDVDPDEGARRLSTPVTSHPTPAGETEWARWDDDSAGGV